MRVSGFVRLAGPMRLMVIGALCVLLCIFLLNFSRSAQTSTPLTQLREDILRLSQLYVKQMAREQSDLPDHRYAAVDTGYDLKKTLAVLLESILARLDRIELIMGQLRFANGSRFLQLDSGAAADGAAANRLSALALLQGMQEDCPLPSNTNSMYPNCEGKIKWMESFWKTDPCYATLGVDGTRCSFIIYLSEVESHCPRMSWRPAAARPQQPVDQADLDVKSLSGLFELMQDNPLNFQWIKQRIEELWPKWLQAYDSLTQKQNWTLANRRRQTILLHLGFLTKESGFKFGEKSLKGGPLGELVQWSDLLASLYILGHRLIISSEIKTFATFAQADPALKSSCPVYGKKHVDLIFTDIVGLRQMKKKIPASLQNYKCRLRVLDSFGTQAQFNYNPYFLRHKIELGGHKRNVWGGHALNLQQFYTMYPHSPDNSFLGFVVQTYSDKISTSVPRHSWALVYGKEAYMWKGAKEFLDAVHDVLPVHATVNTEKEGENVPSYVDNHGVLSGVQFHQLLRQVKVFVGLGFPYEGPAPLEAIANGAIFINPRFSTPKSRSTEKFFSEKPTLRALRSQNPYAEDFIGEPYVLTVDISNKSGVRDALRQALATEIPSYLPYEFTCEGMLERVNAFVEHQDFCDPEKANWPPISASTVLLSAAGDSCSEACWQKQLICEGSYFAKLNHAQVFQKFPDTADCVTQAPDGDGDVSAPGWDGSKCYLQNEALLFSCSGQKSGIHRLCPCRDFIKDQTALCAACL